MFIIWRFQLKFLQQPKSLQEQQEEYYQKIMTKTSKQQINKQASIIADNKKFKLKYKNNQQYKIISLKKSMNKIPIWQAKNKQIQALEQTNLTHSQTIYIPFSSNELQMALIYTDQFYEIFTTAVEQFSDYATIRQKQKDKDNTPGVAVLGSIYNFSSNNKYSVIFDKNNNKATWVQANIYAVISHHGEYFIFMDDINTRYIVHRMKIQQLCDVILKVCSSPRINKRRQRILQKNIKNKIQQQCSNKDTQIRPLRKLTPVFHLHKNTIYILGNKTVHPWQITSPIWCYLCDTNQWKQITNRQLCKSIQYQKKNSGEQLNYSPFQGDGSRSWMLMINQVIVMIKGQYIIIGAMKNGGLDQNGESVRILLIEEDQQLIFQPQIDRFFSCQYKNQSDSGIFILTKPKYQQRSPILLHILLTSCQRDNSTTHTTSTNSQSRTAAKPPQNYKPTKSCITYNNNSSKNARKVIKVDNIEYAIHVERLDIGIFLFNLYGGGGSANRSFSTNFYTSNSTTVDNKCLWDVINDVVFMQVQDTTVYNYNHSHTTTSNNFIKKTPQHTHSQISHQNSTKKAKTLILHTRTKINNPSCIQYLCYSIKLNQLQVISFNDANKQLSYYFQKKQYCDLVFLAEKKEIYCSRQLFQFYSSKFKKLYSSSNNCKNEKNQAQTFVKLDHTKLSTIYFLVQQLYHGFSISLHDFDQNTLIDLMILSHKFQVTQLQALCEQEIKFTCDNFSKLYDYFRNSQTAQFRQQFLKFFIIHAQQIIKMMPIGKVQQLIRLVYSPECTHTNCTQVKAKLENNYSVKDMESGQMKQISKSINYAGIIKGQQISLKICLKCHRLLGFNHESHKKNKSSVRGNSLGGFGHKKKDNNSN